MMMDASPGGGTAAALFEMIWRALASVLGTAATATLLRRAALGAVNSRPELRGLKGLAIVREELEYRYVLPPSWQEALDHSAESLDALRYLVNEQLVPLLTELIGPLGVRLLARLPELARHGIIGEQDEPRCSGRS